MSNLVITGVIDGPLSGGLPKAIELYVVADIADLSVYSLGSANNGGGSDGEEFTFPAESATAGSYIYVASEDTGFASFFGFAPTYTSGAANINGDDAIELFQNGAVVDVFGDINASGAGQPWEHTDGWAYSKDGRAPSTTFDANEWTFSGPNALDAETMNTGAATPFPAQTFDDATTPPADDVFTLELLHIADQEAGALAVADAPNLSAVLNALRAQDLGDDGLADNTLTLSSGDAFIPGVFFDASEAVFGAGGVADIQIQNELGIQAIALGNHEFDFGTRTLSELITGQDVTDDSDPRDGFVDTVPRDIANFDALSGTALDGQTFTGTAFPYLSTNLDYATDPFLQPLETVGGQAPQGGVVSSSTVIDVNGEPIGVIGATTPTLGSISSPGGVGISPTWASGNPTDAELDALAAEIQLEVDALLAADPSLNKVILLAHMQQISIEEALAERLTDVDIIVAGGSNTRLFDDNDRPRDGDSDQGQYPTFITNAGGTTTALVNTDGSYKYVGRLVIDFDANGDIIPESYDETVSGAYATDDQGVADLNAAGLIDPEIQAIADAIEAQIIATESNVFGVSDVFLNGNRSGTFAAEDTDGVRTQETNLGNLTSDANLAAARESDPTVIISLKNGGGIRASIGETIVPAGGAEPVRSPNSQLLDGDGDLIKPAGGISQNDIQTTLAFNNGLVLLTLTAEEIVALLEHSVDALPDVAGQFPQVSGLRFSFDQDNPSGSKIENAGVYDESTGELIAELVRDGEIVDPSAEYRIVTLDFLASPRFDDDGNFTGGGDGYPFPNTNTDPSAGELGDTAVIARINAVFLEQDGVRTGDATFADDGTEQDALAEYLDDNFNPENGGVAFNEAEAGPTADERIQNLDFREDTVLPDTPFEFTAHLVDARGFKDDVVGEITDGADLTLFKEKNRDLTIEVKVDDSDFHGSVGFKLIRLDDQGQDRKVVAETIESHEPYALFGDKFFGKDLKTGKGIRDGDYRLELTFFEGDSGKGEIVSESATNFSVGDGDIDDVLTVGFVNTETDAEIGALDDSFVFSTDAANEDTLGVTVSIDDPRVSAVRLKLFDEDGRVARSFDGEAPFSLLGDEVDGDMIDFLAGDAPLEEGDYTLQIVAFAEQDAGLSAFCGGWKCFSPLPRLERLDKTEVDFTIEYADTPQP